MGDARGPQAVPLGTVPLGRLFAVLAQQAAAHSPFQVPDGCDFLVLAARDTGAGICAVDAAHGATGVPKPVFAGGLALRLADSTRTACVHVPSRGLQALGVDGPSRMSQLVGRVLRVTSARNEEVCSVERGTPSDPSTCWVVTLRAFSVVGERSAAEWPAAGALSELRVPVPPAQAAAGQWGVRAPRAAAAAGPAAAPSLEHPHSVAPHGQSLQVSLVSLRQLHVHAESLADGRDGHPIICTVAVVVFLANAQSGTIVYETCSHCKAAVAQVAGAEHLFCENCQRPVARGATGRRCMARVAVTDGVSFPVAFEWITLYDEAALTAMGLDKKTADDAADHFKTGGTDKMQAEASKLRVFTLTAQVKRGPGGRLEVVAHRLESPPRVCQCASVLASCPACEPERERRRRAVALLTRYGLAPGSALRQLEGAAFICRALGDNFHTGMCGHCQSARQPHSASRCPARRLSKQEARAQAVRAEEAWLQGDPSKQAPPLKIQRL